MKKKIHLWLEFGMYILEFDYLKINKKLNKSLGTF